MLPKSTQSGFSPRLGDVKDAFPMPGKYHFRFKSSLIPGTDREKGAIAVWMDCIDDDQRVGVWRNGIFAKVTRLSMHDEEDDAYCEEYNCSTDKVDSISRSSTRSAPQPATTPTVTPSQERTIVPESDTLLGVFDNPTPSQQALPHSSTSSENLLDHPSLTQFSQNGEESLLDMNSPTYNKNDNASVFLGMTATPAQKAPVSAPTPSAHSTFTSQGKQNKSSFHGSFSQTGDFGGLEWK